MKRLCAFFLIALLALPSLSFAARGFGATSGAGDTDVLTSASTFASTTARTFWVRFKIRAVDATNIMRIVASETATNLGGVFITTAGLMQFNAGWSGPGTAVWTCTAPSVGSWQTFGVTYNGASSSNNPICYLNGTTPAVTTVTPASGTLASATQSMWIGNRAAADRRFDGEIAEVAIWNSVLSAGNIALLEAGVRPDNISVAPLHYWRLCGDVSPEPDEIAGGIAMTVTTGTLKTTHPLAMCSTGSLTLMGVGR